MAEEFIDPEAPFWQQILTESDKSLPRLLFADWCDDNHRPIRAMVQRWLATTRCQPTPMGESWAWVAENCQGELQQQLYGSLPVALFVRLKSDSPGWRGIHSPGIYLYESFRAAEVALETAWEHATTPGWFGPAWRPKFAAGSRGAKLVARRNSSNRWYVVGNSLWMFMVSIGLLHFLIRGCGYRTQPRQNPPSYYSLPVEKQFPSIQAH